MKIITNILRTIVYSVVALCCGALLLFGLPFTGWKALDIATGSMRPAMPPGTLVIVKNVPDRSLRVGDVITYNSLLLVHQTVTHRIIRVTTAGNGVLAFITKGDANPAPDPEVVAGQVVGKMELHVPVLGGLLNDTKKPAGLALLVILPCLLIVWYELKLLGKTLSEPIGGTQKTQPEPLRGSHEASKDLVSTSSVPAAKVERPSVRRRSLDGVRISKLLLLGIITLALGTGTTHALLTSNKVQLVNNLVVFGASPSPTPSPSPSPCTASISGITGPGSVNIAKCTSSTTNTTTNSNTITVTNTNNQNSTTGSSTGSSGSSSNNNTTTTNVTNITY